MKKILATLVALCLLCTGCIAMADMEIPEWDSMPYVVDSEKVEQKAFEGEWVLNVAFAGRTYVDEQTMAGTYGFNFMPLCITEGMVTQDLQQENGEFVTVEMPVEFDVGQLHGKDGSDRDFVVELLEDGNIVVSVFYPGEGDAVICLSVFMVHPEE